MLAHHPQYDARLAGGRHHAPRRLHAGGDGLLHLDVLLRFGADLQGLQAEIRERADVHDIHAGVAAHLLVRADELRAVPVREPAAGLLVDIRANGQPEADVAVGLGVFPGDRAGSDHSDVHNG